MKDLPSVETTGAGTCLVVKVHGVMDYSSQTKLLEQLTQAIDCADQAVVMDLTDVPFCDSAGVVLLLKAHRAAQKAAVPLVLACVPVSLRRILEVTGIDQVLQVFDTIDDARTAMSS